MYPIVLNRCEAPAQRARWDINRTAEPTANVEWMAPPDAGKCSRPFDGQKQWERVKISFPLLFHSLFALGCLMILGNHPA